MEERGEYGTDAESAAVARLREVLTPGQMLHLADLLGEVIAQRFGAVTIRVRNDRVFMEPTQSHDCGKIAGR
jgi:hypothetical protein